MINILLAASLVLNPNPMIGKTYEDGIRGTGADPVLISQNTEAIDEFASTLKGPQKPAIIANIDGREFLVFETCMQMLCSDQHAVIAIDTKTGEQYSAVYALDGSKHVLVNAPFGRAIDNECAIVACQFEPAQRGSIKTLDPISEDDLNDLPGGAFCAHYDSKGEMVLYTEGVGKMFWSGKLRTLREDGIGTTELFTDDDLSPLKIEVSRVSDFDLGYERAAYSAVLNILDENEFRWYSTAVTVICES